MAAEDRGAVVRLGSPLGPILCLDLPQASCLGLTHMVSAFTGGGGGGGGGQQERGLCTAGRSSMAVL